MKLEAQSNSFSDRELRSRETLRAQGIEIEYADLEKDAKDLANLWSNPLNIEHFAGIAPPDARQVNVRRFRDKNPHLNILVATPSEIIDYHEKRPGIRILVARDHTQNGKVVGTGSIELPGLGILGGSVSRLAVDPIYQEKGIATEIHNARHALLFASPKEGGLGLNHSRAAVILGINGSNIPLTLNQKLGYEVQTQTRDTCMSWDNREGRFVERSAVPMFLYRDKYLDRLRKAKRTITEYIPM